jgi:hypothetical protein
MKLRKCTVPGCSQVAVYEVILYSVDLTDQYIIYLRDDRSPYLCLQHKEVDVQDIANTQGMFGRKGTSLLKAYCPLNER